MSVPRLYTLYGYTHSMQTERRLSPIILSEHPTCVHQWNIKCERIYADLFRIILVWNIKCENFFIFRKVNNKVSPYNIVAWLLMFVRRFQMKNSKSKLWQSLEKLPTSSISFSFNSPIRWCLCSEWIPNRVPPFPHLFFATFQVPKSLCSERIQMCFQRFPGSNLPSRPQNRLKLASRGVLGAIKLAGTRIA